MTHASVPLVESLRVGAEQTLHTLRDTRKPGFYDEVDVRVHEAESVHPPSVEADNSREQCEERQTIVHIAEDREVVEPSRVDV